MDGNKKKMDKNKESSHQRGISGMAKKMEELSILSDTETFFLSFYPNGKAELVLGPNTNFEDMVNKFVKLSPKERYESEQEGIKALKEAFKENSKHQIDVQPRMNLGGSGTSQAIKQGQQSFPNLTEEIYPKDKKFGELSYIEQLKFLKTAYETAIYLIESKKAQLARLRDRASASTSASAGTSASASTSAIQHSAMNHPGPLNGNDLMNQGTNLLQPNMNSGSNSDDHLMAAPAGSEEEERDPDNGN